MTIRQIWLMVLALAICILVGGCAYLPLNRYYYYATGINIGNVDVADFYTVLYDDDTGYILNVDVAKKQDFSTGPFVKKPHEQILVKWKNTDFNVPLNNLKEINAFAQKLKKQKPIECLVTLKLPKEFTPKKGYEIIFYIDPDNSKVYVSYEIQVKLGGIQRS